MSAQLTAERLSLGPTRSGGTVVADVSISLAAGEIVALIGESGAGKSSLGLAMLGRVRSGLAVRAGAVRLGDVVLTGLDPVGLRAVRGTRVSYVAQYPAAALNPALRIGAQLVSVLRAHGLDRHPTEGRDRVREALEAAALPPTDDVLRRFPHQLSGGQLHRAALAIALVADPEVVVLDEPTTGLDDELRTAVLATVRRRCDDAGLAVLCITHDVAIAAAVADRLCVMYAGSIVEDGPTATVLGGPAHPYTRHLLAARPDARGRRAMVGLPGRAPDPAATLPGCRFAPRCSLVTVRCTESVPDLAAVGDAHAVRCVAPFAVPLSVGRAGRVRHASRPRDALLQLRGVSASFGGDDVVRGVDLDIARGEWLALVGPSGSGKTTLARIIAGLHRAQRGTVELAGEPLAASARRRTPAQRRAVQMILQHPHASFNPRRTIGASVARPLRLAGRTRRDTRDAVATVLTRVALGGDLADRHPHELSGGELQRAAIARALVAEPAILVCDEITSSLDTIVTATIVDLLVELNAELATTILFLTHDLALVGATAERTAVMHAGRLVRVATTSAPDR